VRALFAIHLFLALAARRRCRFSMSAKCQKRTSTNYYQER
jgi:hypothetical protein